LLGLLVGLRIYFFTATLREGECGWQKIWMPSFDHSKSRSNKLRKWTTVFSNEYRGFGLGI